MQLLQFLGARRHKHAQRIVLAMESRGEYTPSNGSLSAALVYIIVRNLYGSPMSTKSKLWHLEGVSFKGI